MLLGAVDGHQPLNARSGTSTELCSNLPTLLLVNRGAYSIIAMSDEEDDYLSDKFLLASAAAAPIQPKTYAERRKEAQKLAQIKNEQNRHKSRRQIELESREEGLSKSLFERAKEEEELGITSGNKALSMMMKMGFKPGQALGKLDPPQTADAKGGESSRQSPPALAAGPSSAEMEEDAETKPESARKPKHTIEPIPINEWMGALYFTRQVPHLTVQRPRRKERHRSWEACTRAFSHVR